MLNDPYCLDHRREVLRQASDHLPIEISLPHHYLLSAVKASFNKRVTTRLLRILNVLALLQLVLDLWELLVTRSTDQCLPQASLPASLGSTRPAFRSLRVRRVDKIWLKGNQAGVSILVYQAAVNKLVNQAAVCLLFNQAAVNRLVIQAAICLLFNQAAVIKLVNRAGLSCPRVNQTSLLKRQQEQLQRRLHLQSWSLQGQGKFRVLLADYSSPKKRTQNEFSFSPLMSGEIVSL